MDDSKAILVLTNHIQDDGITAFEFNLHLKGSKDFYHGEYFLSKEEAIKASNIISELLGWKIVTIIVHAINTESSGEELDF